MFIDKTKLTEQEIEFKEKQFQVIFSDIIESSKIRNELLNFFKSNSSEPHKYTYWRWFVELTWARLNLADKSEIVEIISKQVPLALMLNYDGLAELLNYFHFRMIDEVELKSTYLKIKNSFLNSTVIVGTFQGRELTLLDLVNDFSSIRRRGDDSLEEAEFASKLKQLLFPKNEPLCKKYFFVEPDKAIGRLIEFIVFFQTVSEKDISRIVENYMNQGYQPELIKASVEPVREGVANPTQKKAKPMNQQKPTPAQIKSQIESQFKKDAEGNFINMEEVYEKLNEFAEKNNDPSILELYYFDESAGKFKWKE